MTTFALASEYPRLSSSQKDQVDHIIADDSTWTTTQIASYMADYKGGTPGFDLVTERRESWAYDRP